MREYIGLIVTDVVRPELHYYPGRERAAGAGAIIIAPGGGYWIQAWDHEGTKFVEPFTEQGWDVYLLRYRLPGRETEPACASEVALRDAKRAMALVRARSKGNAEYPIAFMGFSAGGHLAGSIAVHGSGDEGTLPDASILVYPVTIMNDGPLGHAGSAKNLLGEGYRQRSDAARYDLPRAIDGNEPPTLLVHASDDRGVPPQNSLQYYEALLAHGVPASLRIYEEGGHGFGRAEDGGLALSNWLREVIDWLYDQGF